LLQKVSDGRAVGITGTAVLTVLSQRCGMAEKKGAEALETEEDSDG